MLPANRYSIFAVQVHIDEVDVRTLGMLVLITIATAAHSNEGFAEQHGWLFASGTADWDIFVATARTVEDRESTNGNPPLVDIEVEEVLRGHLQRGPLQARWATLTRFGCGNETRKEREAYRAWLEQPFSGPEPDSRWILAGYRGASGEYVVHPSGRYAYDPALAEWIRGVVATTTAPASREP